ncbi:hypothetical protein MSG28_002669 [Choristoneura fumiferana]|uniref:Uncharacterized protein n=1 Tax=Choristoneura fumiferana TaxID=7141 RepID=A0ACC0JIU4_CHOFU|nr:hypothetical protein MSG28_002669 [Choristoneura fumiferana]
MTEFFGSWNKSLDGEDGGMETVETVETVTTTTTTKTKRTVPPKSSSTKTTTMTTPAKLFGRELSNYDEVDVDELLSKLSQEELTMLAKEVDPDDPTGPLNRKKLIEHINKQALETPDRPEVKPFVAGVVRGKKDQYHASLLNKGQPVGLGWDGITKATKQKIYPMDPPNDTDPESTIKSVQTNDQKLTDLNWNNIKSLKTNTHLEVLNLVNVGLTDRGAGLLAAALEANTTLRVVNVETNFISPTGVVLLRSQVLGNKIEMEITALVEQNPTLLRLGLHLEYSDARHRVPYGLSSAERATTPFSDFFSESETGTPDFRSEESDSSSGSALRRSNAEATKTLLSEWERIERTLYNEEGEKSSRPQIIEECKQWRQLHPQLRVVGKAIPLPDKRLSCRTIEHEEVIAMHYSDYEEFSESEERLSQSSTDVTPQNSPRVSIEDLCEPKLMREKVSFYPMFAEDHELPDTFCSLLQITPIHIHSPLHKKRQNPFIKSEIASSRWMRNSRPDSSVNYDRNSAKSFVSLDPRTYGNLALSATEKNNGVNMNGRVITARSREPGKLEPLYTPELHQDVHRLPSGFSTQHNARKVSLPPLLLEEEKRKVSSAKKHNIKSRRASKNGFHLDRVK